MNSQWFETSQIEENVFLTKETKFFEGNRCNIWLIKGPAKDVIIDTGLGVCDLKEHLLQKGLLNSERQCEVILTHAHYDHSGGAHHFDQVFAHEDDQPGIRHARQTETLNYVKSGHFYEKPYPGFSAYNYKVPPTPCQVLRDGDRIDLGAGDYLQIIHTPGHTKGSISIWYPAKRVLFTGDFVYDCGQGEFLFDWLPTSSVRDFLTSAENMVDFIGNHDVVKVYPGHFRSLTASRTSHLLNDYINNKQGCGSKCSASCMQCTAWCFFLLGCFRCCPC